MKRFTETEIKEMVTLYQDHRWACGKIAKHLGRWQPVIREKLISIGIAQRSPREAIQKIYTYDRTFFDKVDTEEKAYWLGFIAADGGIIGGNTIYIGLSSVDHKHLQKWLSAIKSNQAVKTRKQTGYLSSSLSSYVAVNSIQMVEGLVRHGIRKRKTYSSFWPNIEQKFLRHFMRGYVDGDGCKQVLRIAEYLYADAIVWLDRKLAKLQLHFDAGITS